MDDLELLRQAIAEHGCNNPDSVRPRCHACGSLWPCLVAQMAEFVDLAVLGARVMAVFVENGYGIDIDGGDIQEWATDAGCFVCHAKQPLGRELTDAEWTAGVTGLCDGEPCNGETEPGDACYHMPPQIAATVAALTQMGGSEG